VNHSRLEADKYRNRIRKSINHAYANIEKIKDEAHLVIANLVPENDDELALTKDQIVNVLKKERTGWWLAEDPETSTLGWVPADYLKRKKILRVSPFSMTYFSNLQDF